MLVIEKHYLVVTIFTSKREKVSVKKVFNLQLSLLRILPPGEVLQQPTQLKNLSTVVPMEGERRILPLEKLKVHTRFS
jgi:hypothetical protein